MKLKITILFLLLALTINSAFANVTTEQRDYVSDQMYRQLEKQGKIKEAEDHKKIAQIFSKLKKNTRRKNINYQLSISEDKNINAYALPNGKIVLNRGLITALQGREPSCLAFIIAHEISHIEKRHIEKRIQNALFTGILVTFLVRKSNNWVKALSGLSYGLVVSGYSRGNETEADYEAVELMRNSGYDPNGALYVLKLLEEMEKKKGNPRIFPTHPRAADRYKNVMGWMKEKNITIDEPTGESLADAGEEINRETLETKEASVVE
ncbi:MAG: M48 family metallopeptidase [Vulcanimicrobiota bacterium]